MATKRDFIVNYGLQTDTTGSSTGNTLYVDQVNDKVGIGNSQPSKKLDVTGDINFTGDLYKNGSLFSGGGGSFTVQTRAGSQGTPQGTLSTITTLTFNSQNGFSVTSLGNGEALINLGSTFAPWQVTGQTTLQPTGEEPIQFVASTGIQITTNATSTPKQIIFATTGLLSSSTTSTQNGYFGNLYLYDDSTPSHYLEVTNSANLTAQRSLSINVNDADRTISLSGNLTVSSATTISGTNTGDQTITLTGDVTGSGTGSFAATIANDSVTYAKIQNVTSSKVLGRTTTGAGDVEELSITGSGNVVFSTSPSFTTSATTGSTSFDVFNTTATTVNAFGAAITLSIGSASGTTTVNNNLSVTGTATATTFSGSGASLNSLNASNLGSGTVPTARLASGTANSTTYLRGDQTWASISAGSTVTVSDTAPASPSSGNLWWKSDEGHLKIYYSDGDSSQWIDASPTLITSGYTISAEDGIAGKKIIRLTSDGGFTDDVTFVAGTNISLTRSSDEITINSTASGGISAAESIAYSIALS